MGIIEPPKRWAYLVAVGPASILSGLFAFVVSFAGLPALELFIITLVLGVMALPSVLVGIWRDTRVVKAETGIVQRAWVWNVLAIFLAPLVGTVYLYHRRRWFADNTP